MYQMCIGDSLQWFPEEIETEFYFFVLNQSYVASVEQSITIFETKYKIRQRLNIWNVKIREAVKRSRHLWWEGKRLVGLRKKINC